MKAKTKRRNYLREAFVMLALASMAVRLVPPARLLHWAGKPPKRSNRFAMDEVEWVAWAVEAIAVKGWFATTSFSRALATQSMLRRRGITSSLCIGIARSGRSFAQQAWIEYGAGKVVGEMDGSGLIRMGQFGGEK